MNGTEKEEILGRIATFLQTEKGKAVMSKLQKELKVLTEKLAQEEKVPHHLWDNPITI